MTTTALSIDTTSVLAEFTGGSSSNIAMMIGIGLVKDSEAVFFQYLGDDQTPQALMLPSGKPLTRMANVRLAEIGIAEDIGEFKSTKLNLVLESSAGNTIMMTSGLSTIWSQCVITALMGMFNSYNLETPFQLDTWKGTSKMRPCFAAIRCENQKISDQMLYDQLADARSDRDSAKVQAIMRDSVDILAAAISQVPAEVAIIENDEKEAKELF
jgi:hypothetical protein